MSRKDAIQDHINTKSDYDTRTWYLRTDILPAYKARTSDNFIDIVPPKDEDCWFGLKIFVHYNIGPDNSAVLCLTSMKKGNCPICQEKRNMPLGVDGKMTKEAKDLNASIRFVYRIVDRLNQSEEEKGMQIYDGPKTLDQEIRNLSRHPKTKEVIDISDPEEGFTLYYRKEGEGLLTSYGGFRLFEREYKVVTKEMIEGTQLEEFLIWNTFEEIQDLFLGYSSTEEEEPSTSTLIKGRKPVSGFEEEAPKEVGRRQSLSEKLEKFEQEENLPF